MIRERSYPVAKATAITAGLTAPELIDLDLAYAPSVSTVWDPFQLAARNALAALHR